MNRCPAAPFLRLCLLVWLAALAVPQSGAKAQSGPERAVNPLTGAPLSLEQMHWSLEQAHLEEQLQASLLNRRKFELERQRLDLGGGAPPSPAGSVAVPGDGSWPGSGLLGGRVQSAAAAAAVAPLPLPPVVGIARAAPAVVAEPAHGRTRLRKVSTRQPDEDPALQVVGARARGAAWCLLVSEAQQLLPVCAGEWRRGHHVQAVSAQAYTVDGVSRQIDLPAGQLHAGPSGGTTAAAIVTPAGLPEPDGGFAASGPGGPGDPAVPGSPGSPGGAGSDGGVGGGVAAALRLAAPVALPQR
ncbi:MAG: hypothetical protein KGI67_04075 [Pseudomonadota bacterium]|nr:hypothetical protein [Pseudomonadota bacterium]